MAMRTRNILTDEQYRNMGTTREQVDADWDARMKNAPSVPRCWNRG